MIRPNQPVLPARLSEVIDWTEARECLKVADQVRLVGITAVHRDFRPIGLLDTADEEDPMVYLQGSGAIPGLEKGLAGLEAGAEKTVEVPAAEGFGERDASKVLEVPRGQLPPGVQVGTMLAAQDASGYQMALVVLELGDYVARLDANHPLAGQDLTFEVKVLKVEQATADEIAHGHVH